jgi:polyisoprenyl-phosphate glycosyltransferase
MDTIPHISVVIPVYKAERSLHELYRRLKAAIEPITRDFEIIMVEDSGGDNSWEIMKRLRETDSRVKIIQLMRNFGQHNALMCGFHFVSGEYVVTLDDDLQNPPEEIPKLINKMKEGHDVVYGIYTSKRHNLFRNFGSSMIQYFYKKVFAVQGNLTAFRIIRRQVLQEILHYDKNYVFIDGLIAWVTKKIGYVEVTHDSRTRGHSGYTFKKLFTLSMNMITNFSIVPLQISAILGFLFAFLGFFMAFYFFLKKIFFNIPVAGYTSLIIAVTIFSGIQLVTIGLIGEYVGRIHLNINVKPQYLIRESKVE